MNAILIRLTVEGKLSGHSSVHNAPLTPANISKFLSSYLEGDTQHKSANTLYRPKREYELWSLLQKMISHISTAIQKIIENLREKKAQLETQLLRSRQRVTYKRMLQTVPQIHMAFLSVFVIVLEHLANFRDNIIDVGAGGFEKTIKKCKKYLKMCENLEVYVDKEKYRWEECSKIIKEFVHHASSA